jgi:hypothetical protein
VQFYSWVWASGQHGGERLFHPYPGHCHILFLREEGGYLHTVGDYAAYDLEIRQRWLPAMVAGMRAGPESEAHLFERIVDARLKAELEIDATAISPNYWPRDMGALEGLTSTFYVASRLDEYCRHLGNPFGRFAACVATANGFSGRCGAYRLAREADPAGVEAAFVTGELERCEAREEDTIGWLRANNWPLPDGYGRRQTAERHRLAMRLYASAIDPSFHAAACTAAAAMPEVHDIPECGNSGEAKP